MNNKYYVSSVLAEYLDLDICIKYPYIELYDILDKKFSQQHYIIEKSILIQLLHIENKKNTFNYKDIINSLQTYNILNKTLLHNIIKINILHHYQNNTIHKYTPYIQIINNIPIKTIHI